MCGVVSFALFCHSCMRTPLFLCAAAPICFAVFFSCPSLVTDKRPSECGCVASSGSWTRIKQRTGVECRPPLLYAHPLGHHVPATLKIRHEMRKIATQTERAMRHAVHAVALASFRKTPR